MARRPRRSPARFDSCEPSFSSSHGAPTAPDAWTVAAWPDVREVPLRLCRYKIATNVPPQGLFPLRAKPGGNRASAGGPHCRTRPHGGAGKPEETALTPSPRGQQRHEQALPARYATKMSPEATGCVIRAVPPAFPADWAGGEETLGRRAAGSSEARFYDMTMLWFSRDRPAFRRKPGRSGRRAGRDAPRRLPVPRRKGTRDNLVASHTRRRSRPRRRRRSFRRLAHGGTERAAEYTPRPFVALRAVEQRTDAGSRQEILAVSRAAARPAVDGPGTCSDSPAYPESCNGFTGHLFPGGMMRRGPENRAFADGREQAPDSAAIRFRFLIQLPEPRSHRFAF